MLSRLLREPLVHFLGLALLIFAAYSLLNSQGLSQKPRIDVTAAKIEQLSGLFVRSWQRLPTPEELKGLIDDYVKEEIYYREATKLGLETDDTVIRRRLRLKMELLNEAAADQLTPSETELKSYFLAHADTYQTEPKVAFEQIFLSPEKRGAAARAAATRLLQNLRTDVNIDPAAAGDSTLLPFAEEITSRSGIAHDFGSDFADSVTKLSPGEWTGPIESSFGLHIVRVSQKSAGHLPQLSEVHDAVLRDWRSDQLKSMEETRLAEFASHYDIVVESSDSGAARGTGPKP